MSKSRCGPCYACCFAPAVDDEELQKDAWGHCPHLRTGHYTKGMCRIHETRPGTCRSFACGYFDNPHLSLEYRPDRCQLMIVGRPGGITEVWELSTAKWEGSRLQQAIGFHLRDQKIVVVRKDGIE